MRSLLTCAVLFYAATGQVCEFSSESTVQLTSSSGDLVTSLPYPTLASALSAAQFLPSPTTISLHATAPVPSTTVNTALTIVGCPTATLDVEGTLIILEQGTMVLGNMTIISGKSGLGFSVKGSLKLEQCQIINWVGPVISLIGGEISVLNSDFEGCQQVLISGSGVRGVILADTVFRQNSGKALISIASSAAGGRIEVSNAEFERNMAQAVMSLAGIGLQISGSGFRGNKGVLMEISGANFTVSHCKFEANSGGGIRLAQKGGVSAVRECVWTGNSFPFLWVTLLQGTVLISHSSFTQQAQTAALQITNSGSTESCQVLIFHSVFANSSFYPDMDSAAVMYSVQCSVSFIHSLVHNCTAMASTLSRAYAAVFGAFSSLELRNTSLVQSGGSGASLAGLLSTLYVSDLNVTEPVLGSNGALIILGCSFLGSNLRFSGGSFAAVVILDRRDIYYVMFEMSSGRLDGFISENHPEPIISALTAFYSSMTYTHIVVRNVTGFAVLSHLSSHIVASDLLCQNTSWYVYFEGEGTELTQLSNVTIEDTVFEAGLVISVMLKIELRDIRLKRVVAKYVLHGGFMQAWGQGIQVEECRLKFLVMDFIRSMGVFVDLRYTNSIGGLATAYSSNLTLGNCTFDRISSLSLVISLRNSNLQLSNSTIQSVNSNSFLQATHLSLVTLTQVSILSIAAQSLAIFHLEDSEMTLTSSHITEFTGTLVVGVRASVELRDSSFSFGGFTRLTEKGPQIQSGGLLRCLDCSKAILHRVRVQDLSADLGGAAYISATDVSTQVNITDSHFEGLTANDGGAIYALNVTLSMAKSSFSNCSASAKGGALLLSLRSTDQHSIQQVTFTHNSAQEGGAIQWLSSPLSLPSSTFTNNSAYYGQDQASFAMGLSALLPDPVPPGQDVNMTVVLLDHFGSNVTTAAPRPIRLASSDWLQFKGITDRLTSAGVVEFYNVQILAASNSTHTLTFYSPGNGETLSLTVVVEFRDCVVGEIVRVDSCLLCLPGSFSWDLEDKNCSLCPRQASCPGGTVVSPKAGAWLSTDPANPVLNCPIPEACLGSPSNLCAKGYMDKLCSNCAPAYFHLVASTCVKCPHPAVFAVELLAVVTFFLLLLSAAIHYSIKRPSPRKLLLLRTLVSHIQYLGVLAYVRVPWPLSFQVFLRAMLALGSFYTATFPAYCFGLNYYWNVGAGCLLCAILICVLAVFVLFRVMWYRKWTIIREELPSLVYFLCYLLPPAASLALLPLFSCQSAGDLKTWLVLDPSEECWSDSHLSTVQYLCIPGLLLSVLLPLLCQAVLCRSQLAAVFLQEYRWGSLQCVFEVVMLLGAWTVIGQMAYSASSQLLTGLIVAYLLTLYNGLTPLYRREQAVFLPQSSFFILCATYTLLISVDSDNLAYALTSIVTFLNLVLICVYICLLVIASPVSEASQCNEAPLQVPNNSFQGPNNSLADPQSIDISIAL